MFQSRNWDYEVFDIELVTVQNNIIDVKSVIVIYQKLIKTENGLIIFIDSHRLRLIM